MFRPDTSFLDFQDQTEEFRNELMDLCAQTNANWNPHTKLEYTKVCILGVHSKLFNNNLNRQLEQCRVELNKLITFKNKMSSCLKIGYVISLQEVCRDIDICIVCV
jgi:hypothetical protein